MTDTEVEAWKARLEEAEAEIRRSHAALDRIHRYLLELGPTLTTLEQVLLCPIDNCKWRKHPEWEERYEYLQTSEGKVAEEIQFRTRVERLKESTKSR